MSVNSHGVMGTGGGMAFVADNALRVRKHSAFKEAVKDGRAFSWSALTYDMAAADTVMGLENNDPNRDLYIEKLWIASDTDTAAQVFTSSAITVAGTTAISGVNLNRSSNRVALSTAYTAETGQNEAASSWPSRLYMPRILADITWYQHVDGKIVLPYDYMIGVDMAANAGAINVTVWGWYE